LSDYTPKNDFSELQQALPASRNTAPHLVENATCHLPDLYAALKSNYK